MAKKILMVGTEAMPFAATGGLGDVLGSLPAACKAQDAEGLDVRVVMPLYSSIKHEYREKMEFITDIIVPLAWRQLYCGIFKLEKDGVIYYFIDNEYYFKRGEIYGSYDDGERFAYFCSAVMHIMPVIDFFPDILHAHDWQSALTVIYLKTIFRYSPRYANMRAVFTIHNIAYQGQYDLAILGDVFGLDIKYASIVAYAGCINLMKGAIVCADKVTTVSPTYAKEIRYPAHSKGLHYILRENNYKLSGILNGIDYNYYNPSKDEVIYKKYSVTTLKNKAVNKTEFQKEFGLPERADVPLIAIISRLVDHKGIDIVSKIMESVIQENDVQLVVLGRGDKKYEDYFMYLQNMHPSQVKTLIMYDRDVSKKIYAAADIFVMPSLSEPCGLAQMIASRYGAVPVTRETGGLYDSIKGYYEQDGELFGNGFTFANYSEWELKDRICAALGLYKDTKKWNRFVKIVMKTDFSWDISAKKYIDLYNNM